MENPNKEKEIVILKNASNGDNLNTAEYTELFKNRKNKREFKGALTNTASFDNSDLNTVKYLNGKEINDGGP